jgi:hypothetical protein
MITSIRSISTIAQVLGLALLAGTAVGQTQPASTITKLTAVDVEQMGRPPTGPFAIVIEHDPGLATHTIYRPRELSLDEHPVLVWGEGGCAKNGLMFPEYLSEIASHGFVVIADGPPIARPAGGPPNGANGPPPGAGDAARAGGGPAPGGGPPADRFTRSTARRSSRRSTGWRRRARTAAAASTAGSASSASRRWACRAAG